MLVMKQLTTIFCSVIMADLTFTILILLDVGVFMYKTQKGLAPDGFIDLYHSITEVHSYNTRSANKGNLQIPLTNLRTSDKAISVSGARVWNNIPDGIKQSGENHRNECHRFWLRLRHAVILIPNDRTSASKK